jgi:hypothetical protein
MDCRRSRSTIHSAQLGKADNNSVSRSSNLAHFGLRHSSINQPVPNQRRLNDWRRQSIGHLIYLRRDGGTQIAIKFAEGKVRHPVFKGLPEDL